MKGFIVGILTMILILAIGLLFALLGAVSMRTDNAPSKMQQSDFSAPFIQGFTDIHRLISGVTIEFAVTQQRGGVDYNLTLCLPPPLRPTCDRFRNLLEAGFAPRAARNPSFWSDCISHVH